MFNQQKKQFDDDDGRVICNMDVEGMPWHESSIRLKDTPKQNILPGNQMTQSEARRFTWHAVLAGLLIATVFSAAWVLFILFCTKIWFA